MKKSLLLTVLIYTLFSDAASGNEPIQPLSWQTGFHKTKEAKPSEWYPSEVPGAVQLDYAKAKNWKDHMWAENWKEYRWMEDVFWTYRTTFRKPELAHNEQLFFFSNGIDYQFEILLNGEQIFAQEGMFKPVECNLTGKLKPENLLEVVIYPVPKIPGRPEDRSQAAQSAKPAVSYGWDWHPRLVPSGIWDETGLVIRESAWLSEVYINYRLSDDFSKADIRLDVSGNGTGDKQFTWTLADPHGKEVIRQTGRIEELTTRSFLLEKPHLWWTHDHGKPLLYTSVFLLSDHTGKLLSEQTQKVGFRRIRLVMHEGAWNKPDTFPKGRSNPPITVELNGRRIFAKGTNWVNPEIFPGVITRERYNRLLDLALEAHFNLLRVWGGGIVNKESFYELCDEKGLLAWTEFPLACNNYEGTPHYLSVLEQESEAIIRRVRGHASHALWCGGNELFNSWSGMTDQSLAIRLLNSQCYLLDPQTPFIPTSPVMGMSHGNYIFKYFDNGREVFQQMPRSVATAYTEFGMPGAASVELLKKIIPENELYPPQRGTSWESHHAFGAWVGDTWLMKDLLKEYFGEAKTLEELVAQSQWLQTEGYKCIFEEGRRQKPVCSMTLNWCYNEPWITAANNSLISYPDIPKPAFYGVSDASRPFLASARIPKFSWRGGELFSCELFILNDLYENIPSGVVQVKIRGAAGQELKLLSWEFGKAPANLNLQGPTVRGILPDWNTDRIELVLEVEENQQYSSKYILKYRSSGRSNVRTGTPRMNE